MTTRISWSAPPCTMWCPHWHTAVKRKVISTWVLHSLPVDVLYCVLEIFDHHLELQSGECADKVCLKERKVIHLDPPLTRDHQLMENLVRKIDFGQSKLAVMCPQLMTKVRMSPAVFHMRISQDGLCTCQQPAVEDILHQALRETCSTFTSSPVTKVCHTYLRACLGLGLDSLVTAMKKESKAQMNGLEVKVSMPALLKENLPQGPRSNWNPQTANVGCLPKDYSEM